ncbi:hypothetical protein, variant [Aphanomyces invadans]|uniref:RNase NYN domain-containing protein n=1 Tax=Aphanomyces invadans TaxID=157072 RepID=A0A024TF31_9STRA|nr:hypothetical protein, variant [Aphanomyces invadans]ETV92653.1 hypothetical protein, variant [Aphanomyces invadans]|eukprot:XP_008878688.1 hypothetical protein, variant [Aphanomyces invadans]
MATVVVDAANVATVSGGNLRVQRLEAALDYFQRRNVRCIAFAPRYWIDGNTVFNDEESKKVLQSLVNNDTLVLTPPQAHDDFYVIDYATKYDGYVVSNDMFRDHVMHKRRFNGHTLTVDWVKARCIDFTFVGLEFLPNSQLMDKVLHHVPRAIDPAIASSTSISPSAHSQNSSIQVVPSSSMGRLADMATEDGDVDMGGGHHDVCFNAKRVVDMSEAVYIDVPMPIVTLLHDNDDAGLKYFQELSGTYMQLPRAVPLGKDTTKLSIHGREACERAMHAVHSFLLEYFHQHNHVQQPTAQVPLQPSSQPTCPPQLPHQHPYYTMK